MHSWWDKTFRNVTPRMWCTKHFLVTYPFHADSNIRSVKRSVFHSYYVVSSSNVSGFSGLKFPSFDTCPSEDPDAVRGVD